MNITERESSENKHLAVSCGQTNVACCKEGFIFLPRSEYEAILSHLKNDVAGLEEFKARIVDHGEFLLYNQKSSCQFLASDNRCQLHPLGIKPTECFWWPGHVYLGSNGTLEIRVASCCGGCSCLNVGSPHIKK